MIGARSLPALHAFVAVARHGGFSAAARALGLSTSAVSQAVRSLEAELGTALLVRTTRRVSLTDAGRRLFEQAGPALDGALQAAQEAARAGDTPIGTLRISIPTAATARTLAPLATALAERAPQVVLDVVVDDRLVDVVQGGFHAGVRLDEALLPGMVAVRLHPPFAWRLVASPAYLARHGTPATPEALVGHVAVGFRYPTAGTVYAWELERDGEGRRISLPPALVCNHNEGLRQGALAGLGLTYLDAPTVAEDLAAGRLVSVLEAWMPASRGWFVYFPTDARTDPKVRALVDAARAVDRALAG